MPASSHAALWRITVSMPRGRQTDGRTDARLLHYAYGSCITPVLTELHWLPVRQRIDFKLAVHVYKALHGQLPQYLAEDCQLLTDIGRRSLRSADVLTCATRRTRTRLGDRIFPVAGPCLWNSLPVTLRDRDTSLVQFKRLLKTLCLSRPAAHTDCCFFAPCSTILTYLLTFR